MCGEPVWYNPRMVAAVRSPVLAAALATATLVLVLRSEPRAQGGAAPTATVQRQPPAADIASDDEVRAQCGGCHAVPPPDVLPRSAWRDNVARMMLIRSGLPEPLGPPGTAARMVALPPEMQRVARVLRPEGA